MSKNLCAGCDELVDEADVLDGRHLRVDVETYTAVGTGHGCDGTEADCYRRCPVPVPEQAQRQVQVECGPIVEVLS